MKCAICKKKIYDSGNSAAPVAEGRCCNSCYFEHVVPAKKYRYGILIPAKGRAKPYEIGGIGSLMELNSLQESVRGYIQPVTVDEDKSEIILIDEEGKISGKLMNTAATYLAHNHLYDGDYIAGDALLVMTEGENFKYFTYEEAKVRAELINNMTECF